MKKLLIGLSLILATQMTSAAERPFRIDRDASTVNGYAIAWGIPGKSFDFEKLDTMTDEEIEKIIDLDSVKNYVVDIQTNQIITILSGEYDMAVFHIGNIYYGNHFGLGLNNLAVENLENNQNVTTVTEFYKWSSAVSKILVIDSTDPILKTQELDASDTMDVLKNKLRLSILKKNMDLFDTAAENIYDIKTKFVENVGNVNVFTFDYAHPKQDTNALEVIVTVKMKMENGKIVPYVLDVKQRQY